MRFKKHCVRRCSVITQTMFATNPASPPKKQAVETACFLLLRGFRTAKAVPLLCNVNPFGCTRLTFGNNRCKANPRISTIFVVRKSYNSQKAQVTRVSCAFLLLYLVFLSLDKIFEFNSCISALFSKNRS